MIASFVFAAALLLSTALATDFIELDNGYAPNNKFTVRVHAPKELGSFPFLEVVNVFTNTVIGSTHSGGYANFPAVANSNNTSVLWSPDSRHFAVMTRGTKRSIELRLYQVTTSSITEILLPDATKQAFKLLKATESFRCVFQRAQKWKDNKTLLVRASGDVETTIGDKIPIWYEVDISYDIVRKSITNAEIIETKPREG